MKKLYKEDVAQDQQLKNDKIKNIQDQIKIKNEELQQKQNEIKDLQQQLSNVQSGKAVSESKISIKNKVDNFIEDLKKKKQYDDVVRYVDRYVVNYTVNGKKEQKEFIIKDLDEGMNVPTFSNIVKEINKKFEYLKEYPKLDINVKDEIEELEWLVNELIAEKKLDEDGEGAITTSSIAGTATDSLGKNSVTPAFGNSAYYAPKMGSTVSRYGTFTPLKRNKKTKSKNESVNYIDSLIQE